MKRIIFPALALLLFFASSCSKNSSSNPSTRPTFKWTYAGTNYTADTAVAANANSVANYYEIYAQTGPWATPGTTFTIEIPSFSPGNYSDGGTNEFQEVIVGVNTYTIAPFTVTITSSNASTVNGTFVGTLNNQTISGSFSNVQIH